ncbi:hypothetical protein Bbelb_133660 [Branchiostoma belcheri]|nr:hypothetical protein Bbelb_133660 [Branchiostoma belcheri]
MTENIFMEVSDTDVIGNSDAIVEIEKKPPLQQKSTGASAQSELPSDEGDELEKLYESRKTAVASRSLVDANSQRPSTEVVYRQKVAEANFRLIHGSRYFVSTGGVTPSASCRPPDPLYVRRSGLRFWCTKRILDWQRQALRAREDPEAVLKPVQEYGEESASKNSEIGEVSVKGHNLADLNAGCLPAEQNVTKRATRTCRTRTLHKRKGDVTSKLGLTDFSTHTNMEFQKTHGKRKRPIGPGEHYENQKDHENDREHAHYENDKEQGRCENDGEHGHYENEREHGHYENEREHGNYENEGEHGHYENEREHGHYENEREHGHYENEGEHGHYENEGEHGHYENEGEHGHYENEREHGHYENEREHGHYENEREHGHYENEGEHGHYENEREHGHYENEREHGHYENEREHGHYENEGEHGLYENEREHGHYENEREHGHYENEREHGHYENEGEHGLYENEREHGHYENEREHGHYENEREHGRYENEREHGHYENEREHGHYENEREHGHYENEGEHGYYEEHKYYQYDKNRAHDENDKEHAHYVNDEEHAHYENDEEHAHYENDEEHAHYENDEEHAHYENDEEHAHYENDEEHAHYENDEEHSNLSTHVYADLDPDFLAAQYAIKNATAQPFYDMDITPADEEQEHPFYKMDVTAAKDKQQEEQPFYEINVASTDDNNEEVFYKMDGDKLGQPTPSENAYDDLDPDFVAAQDSVDRKHGTKEPSRGADSDGTSCSQSCPAFCSFRLGRMVALCVGVIIAGIAATMVAVILNQHSVLRVHPNIVVAKPHITSNDLHNSAYTVICDVTVICDDTRYFWDDNWWGEWTLYVRAYFQQNRDTAAGLEERYPDNEVVMVLLEDRFFWPFVCRYWKIYDDLPHTLDKAVSFGIGYGITSEYMESHGLSAYSEVFSSMFNALETLRNKTDGLSKNGNAKLLLVRQVLLDTDVEALVKLFPYLKGIAELYIIKSRLSADAATVLAGQLHVLDTLKDLVLMYNTIGDEGMEAIAETFAHLKELRVLNIAKNSITNVGGRAVANRLVHLQQLRKLYLGENELALSVSALAKAFANMTRLEYVSMAPITCYCNSTSLRMAAQQVRDAVHTLAGQLTDRRGFRLYDGSRNKDSMQGLHTAWQRVESKLITSGLGVTISNRQLKVETKLLVRG